MTQTITIKDPKAPATPAQVSYLTSLVEKHECPTVAERFAFAQAAGFLAKGTASNLIDQALKTPKKAAKTGTFVVTPVPEQQAVKQPTKAELPEAPTFGYYLIDGTVYYWDVTGKDYTPALRKLTKITQWGGVVKGKWTKMHASSYNGVQHMASYKPYGPKSSAHYGEKTGPIYVHKILAEAVAAGATPMTMMQAAQQGHVMGFCIRCGATLTDPESVAAGIGPVCKNYWF